MNLNHIVNSFVRQVIVEAARVKLDMPSPEEVEAARKAHAEHMSVARKSINFLLRIGDPTKSIGKPPAIGQEEDDEPNRPGLLQLLEGPLARAYDEAKGKGLGFGEPVSKKDRHHSLNYGVEGAHILHDISHGAGHAPLNLLVDTINRYKLTDDARKSRIRNIAGFFKKGTFPHLDTLKETETLYHRALEGKAKPEQLRAFATKVAENPENYSPKILHRFSLGTGVMFPHLKNSEKINIGRVSREGMREPGAPAEAGGPLATNRFHRGSTYYGSLSEPKDEETKDIHGVHPLAFIHKTFHKNYLYNTIEKLKGKEAINDLNSEVYERFTAENQKTPGTLRSLLDDKKTTPQQYHKAFKKVVRDVEYKFRTKTLGQRRVAVKVGTLSDEEQRSFRASLRDKLVQHPKAQEMSAPAIDGLVDELIKGNAEKGIKPHEVKRWRASESSLDAIPEGPEGEDNREKADIANRGNVRDPDSALGDLAVRAGMPVIPQVKGHLRKILPKLKGGLLRREIGVATGAQQKVVELWKNVRDSGESVSDELIHDFNYVGHSVGHTFTREHLASMGSDTQTYNPDHDLVGALSLAPEHIGVKRVKDIDPLTGLSPQMVQFVKDRKAGTQPRRIQAKGVDKRKGAPGVSPRPERLDIVGQNMDKLFT